MFLRVLVSFLEFCGCFLGVFGGFVFFLVLGVFLCFLCFFDVFLYYRPKKWFKLPWNFA